MTLIDVNEGRCACDGACASVCPAKIFVKKQGLPATVAPGRREQCIRCGHCVAVCPQEAITLEGMEAEQCSPIDRELLPSGESAMHFLKTRRSIRTYLDRKVSRGILKGLIEAARYAPSGYNTQPVHWLIIENREEVRTLTEMVVEWMRSEVAKKSEVARMFNMKTMVMACASGMDLICRNAPHLVITHAPKNESVSRPACMTGLTYLELAAHAQSLGACWAGYFTVAAAMHAPLRRALELPEGHLVYGTLLLGYPKYTYRRIPARMEPRITWR